MTAAHTKACVIRKTDDVAGQSMTSRIYSRLAAERVLDPKTGEVLAEYNDVITHDLARKIASAGVTEVKVRSPMTCELNAWYLLPSATVLTLAAATWWNSALQLVSWPPSPLASLVHSYASHLPYRWCGRHAGADITTGLPRVEEIFEARKMPKGEAVVAEISGVVHIIQSEKYTDMREVHIEHAEMIHDEYVIPEDWKFVAKDESEVQAGDMLATKDKATITAQHGGRVAVEKKDRKIIVSYEQREETIEEIPTTSRLLVKDGAHVEAGQALTEGSLNPHRVLKIQGREACQMYLHDRSAEGVPLTGSEHPRQAL